MQGDWYAMKIRGKPVEDFLEETDKRISDLEHRILRADNLIEQMVSQDCTSDHGYDSMFISTYADALNYLVEIGRMEYVSTPSGRSVLCKSRI